MTAPDHRLGPALLFCPGDRPERFEKAAAAADTVILDLEDAVASDAKDAAREAVAASTLDPRRTIVRVNPGGADREAVGATDYDTVMIAKTETAADVELWDGYRVVALCESPLGVRNAELLAALPGVVALTWGAEDLVAAMGGTSSRSADGSYRDYARFARSRVLIAAASEGKPAIDTVHLDIRDDAGLSAEAADAAASGFAGMMCIHPRQVDLVRAAFRPTPEALAWANRVLEAADATPAGVFALDGRMIDEPVLRQARRIRAIAESISN
jgi:citrate lyase subunit beta/citryl-CoA lyase